MILVVRSGEELIWIVALNWIVAINLKMITFAIWNRPTHFPHYSLFNNCSTYCFAKLGRKPIDLIFYEKKRNESVSE